MLLLMLIISILLFYGRDSPLSESSEKRSHRSGSCINDGHLPTAFRSFVKLFGEDGVMNLINRTI